MNTLAWRNNPHIQSANIHICLISIIPFNFLMYTYLLHFYHQTWTHCACSNYVVTPQSIPSKLEYGFQIMFWFMLHILAIDPLFMHPIKYTQLAILSINISNWHDALVVLSSNWIVQKKHMFHVNPRLLGAQPNKRPLIVGLKISLYPFYS